MIAAWKDRMIGRRGHVLRIAERIAAEGQLAEGWTAEAAADLIYTVTLPGAWRVLTVVSGWSRERYAVRLAELLERSLLARGAGSVTSTSDPRRDARPIAARATTQAGRSGHPDRL